MLQRQQLLLQQLGIQQWIPRQQDVEHKKLDILWRDGKEEAEFSSEIVLIPPSPPEMTQTNVPPAIQNQTSPSMTVTLAETSVIEPIAVDTQQEKISTETALSQTIVFDYQILIHEHFLIFAEIHDSAERTLLNNIQKACFAEQTQLKWPLHVQHWDSADQWVESYMQGFFALHSQPLLILLGDMVLPQCVHTREVFTAPSLQQMLETPLQKRILWQKVYPLIYEISTDSHQTRKINS